MYKKEDKYKEMTEGFIERYSLQSMKSISQLCNALEEHSYKIKPRSFSNLKVAIAFELERNGHINSAARVREMKNFAAITRSYTIKPKKVKVLSAKQHDAIMTEMNARYSRIDKMSAIAQKNYRELAAAINLAMVFGARPCEMPTIRRLDELSFYIHTAKKDEFNERGVDRVIKVKNIEMANTLDRAVALLRTTNMKNVAGRFETLVKKCFPRMKRFPTLYTFRHELGSSLKASSLSRIECAYLMGHASTRTLENYGYKAAGGNGQIDIEVGIPIDEIELIVRDTQKHRIDKRIQRFEHLNDLS